MKKFFGSLIDGSIFIKEILPFVSEFLPIFPLKLVVFPGEKLKLHIFEPRYKQLVNECLEEDKNFGIPPFLNNKIASHGTEIKIKELAKRHENGELDVVTEGVRVFKIDDFFPRAPGKLYAGAEVDFLDYNVEPDIVFNMKILEKVSELFEILKIKKDLPEAPEIFNTFDIAHHVGFSIEQEFDLLKVSGEKERQQMIINHLEQMIPIVREMEKLRIKIKQNGHFKDAIPPDLLS